MSDEAPDQSSELPSHPADRIDAICNRFEAAWREGRPLRIDDCLTDVDDAVLPRLLRELVVLEIELRQTAGEKPFREDYLGRFLHLDTAWLDGLDTQTQSNTSDSNDKPDNATLSHLPNEKQAAGAVDLPSIPGYEILGILGRGGMGVVYKACQTELKRVVALKMILVGAHAGPELRARFRTEAQAIARFHHANIVQVTRSTNTRVCHTSRWNTLTASASNRTSPARRWTPRLLRNLSKPSHARCITHTNAASFIAT